MKKLIFLAVSGLALSSGVCFANQPSLAPSSQAALHLKHNCTLEPDPANANEFTCKVPNDDKFKLNGTVTIDFSKMIAPDTNFGVHDVNFHCHFKDVYPKTGNISNGFVVTSVKDSRHSFNVINDPNTSPKSSSRLVNVAFDTHYIVRNSITLDTCHVNL